MTDQLHLENDEKELKKQIDSVYKNKLFEKVDDFEKLIQKILKELEKNKASYAYSHSPEAVVEAEMMRQNEEGELAALIQATKKFQAQFDKLDIKNNLDKRFVNFESFLESFKESYKVYITALEDKKLGEYESWIHELTRASIYIFCFTNAVSEGVGNTILKLLEDWQLCFLNLRNAKTVKSGFEIDNALEKIENIVLPNPQDIEKADFIASVSLTRQTLKNTLRALSGFVDQNNGKRVLNKSDFSIISQKNKKFDMFLEIALGPLGAFHREQDDKELGKCLKEEGDQLKGYLSQPSCQAKEIMIEIPVKQLEELIAYADLYAQSGQYRQIIAEKENEVAKALQEMEEKYQAEIEKMQEAHKQEIQKIREQYNDSKGIQEKPNCQRKKAQQSKNILNSHPNAFLSKQVNDLPGTSPIVTTPPTSPASRLPRPGKR